MAAPTYLGVAGTGGATSSNTITVSVSISSGDRIAVFIAGAYIPDGTSNGTIVAGTSITDNGGNTYHPHAFACDQFSTNNIHLALFTLNGGFCGVSPNGTYPMTSAAVATSMTVHLPFAYSVSGAVALRYSGFNNLSDSGAAGGKGNSGAVTAATIGMTSPHFDANISAVAVMDSAFTYSATSGTVRGVYTGTGFRIITMDGSGTGGAVLSTSSLTAHYVDVSQLANKIPSKNSVSSCFVSLK